MTFNRWTCHCSHSKNTLVSILISVPSTILDGVIRRTNCKRGIHLTSLLYKDIDQRIRLQATRRTVPVDSIVGANHCCNNIRTWTVARGPCQWQRTSMRSKTQPSLKECPWSKRNRWKIGRRTLPRRWSLEICNFTNMNPRPPDEVGAIVPKARPGPCK